MIEQTYESIMNRTLYVCMYVFIIWIIHNTHRCLMLSDQMFTSMIYIFTEVRHCVCSACTLRPSTTTGNRHYFTTRHPWQIYRLVCNDRVAKAPVNRSTCQATWPANVKYYCKKTQFKRQCKGHTYKKQQRSYHNVLSLYRTEPITCDLIAKSHSLCCHYKCDYYEDYYQH